jgi:hypothetical protein
MGCALSIADRSHLNEKKLFCFGAVVSMAMQLWVFQKAEVFD